MKIDFAHHQSAHCENGVTSNLFRFYGLELSEPMVFGIGGGVFFMHLPFIKVNNAPGTTFRPMPGTIFKRNANYFGIDYKRVKFSSEAKAAQALDEILAQGKPVGLQVGVFHLPYLPIEYRFHFNAHNIVVFGKEGDTYFVSDPVMETTTTITEEELNRVRFAKGAFAPKGQIYYPVHIPEISDDKIRGGIKKGISHSAFFMNAPGPIIGTNGIRYISKKVRQYKEKLGDRKAQLYLGQLVRMQEEIGTGGGGFPYLHAAFLQEAGKKYFPQHDILFELSEQFTLSGDKWREFAMQCATIYRGRQNDQAAYDKAADILLDIHDIERDAFRKSAKIRW